MIRLVLLFNCFGKGAIYYQRLLIETDFTKEAFERSGEVRAWIGEAHAIVAQDSEPKVRTGAHCFNPFTPAPGRPMEDFEVRLRQLEK